MKIHEYQGKQILKSYDIPIQDGLVVENKEDIENAIDKVAEFHNVNKDDIEEYFDNELKEQLGD